MLPLVSVLGSCRVHVPLRKSAEAGLLNVHSENLSSYCHSSKEALQKLRFSNGRIGIPDYLRILINGKEKDGDKMMKMRGDLQKPDIYIIEISSKKRLYIGDYSLQMNFFQDYFVKPNNLESWWLELVSLANTTKKPASLLPKIKLSKEAEYIAKKTTLVIESDESISQDIRKINDYLRKPIVFVGHFDVPREDGRPLKERQALNAIIKEAATSCGSYYFEPVELINSHGAAKSLREKSTNHWAIDFESVVGEHLLTKYILPNCNK